MKFNKKCDLEFDKFKKDVNKPLKKSDKAQFKPFEAFNKEIKKLI